MPYTVHDIARTTGGHLEVGSPHCTTVAALLTDSRNIEAGAATLFFAISTDANDGMRYVPELHARGVRNFVVPRLEPGLPSDANYVVVPDVVKALQQVGAERRREYEGTVVSVTGSRGKTIVKEWIYRALEHFMPAMRSPRSYNSQIGVPLSLWPLSSEFKVAVIEAGISRRGEMEVLAPIINPDVVVLTNVGDEHADGFRSPREHLAEKALLTSGASTIIYDADDEPVARAIEMFAPPGSEKLLMNWSLRGSEATVSVTRLEVQSDSTQLTYTYRGNEESVRLPFTAQWLVADAMHTLTTLLALGMEPAQASWAMRDLHPMRTRIDVSDGVNDCLLASDTFTCDLLSLESALDFINRRADEQGRSRTLVLGELLLESKSEEEVCSRIARLLRLARIDRFIGAAPMFERHRDLFPARSIFFPSPEALVESLSTSDFASEFILIKGAPDSPLHSLRLNLEARTHETVLEVNLNAIVKNFNYFRSCLPHTTGLIAMVKASGYGAGSLEIAKTLQAQGASYLAVAVLDEGIELRRAGITMPILVMNPKVLNYRAMFAHRLEPEIYSREMLLDVIREARKCDVSQYPVHIKLDTGMHRLGFDEAQIPELLDILKETDAVKVSTLFSHLATADCLDMDDYTHAQFERFDRYTERIMQALPYPVKRHILNTAGIVRFPEHHYDYARPGIGLYGVPTLPPDVERPLATVSTLRTVVIAVKERQAGDAIGYGRRDVLTAPATIATIPIGYADGMNRRFGNGRSSVLINGREAPTIGNICMDACMIDVTGIPCRVGDSVEVFGEGMPVQRLADALDTIPYEVLTSISPRVKRIYFRE